MRARVLHSPCASLLLRPPPHTLIPPLHTTPHTHAPPRAPLLTPPHTPHPPTPPIPPPTHCSTTWRSWLWPPRCCAPRRSLCARRCRTGSWGPQVSAGQAAAWAGLARQGSTLAAADCPGTCGARAGLLHLPGWQAKPAAGLADWLPAALLASTPLVGPARPLPWPPGCLCADYAAAWDAVARDIIYIPAQQRYTRAASATAQDRVASLQVGWGGVCVEKNCVHCEFITASLPAYPPLPPPAYNNSPRCRVAVPTAATHSCAASLPSLPPVPKVAP